MMRIFSRVLGTDARNSRGREAQATLPPVQADESDEHELSQFTTDWDDLSGLHVLETELVATTADDMHAPMGGLLARLRDALGLDAVFVSQTLGGQRVVREASHAAQCDPLEEAYCLQLLAGRGVRMSGAAVAMPVIGLDGRVWGTIASSAHGDDGAEPLKRAARLVGAAIERHTAQAAAPQHH
ncbi:MAG TPA: hypothetical protein VHA82_12630 [Ramlibacter sp.]|uniref:hypothetical protein n=1 Tax=Ramlibacter sp. TaxID=1917967 RepID=UPI002B746C50|nr:hypothetical protein [Ramlibacter sp.]HVZ44647.1 hypothetical protein [Ramlibacter sp.]